MSNLHEHQRKHESILRGAFPPALLKALPRQECISKLDRVLHPNRVCERNSLKF